MIIPKNSNLEAFAMIVDINRFTVMVEKNLCNIAQDVRDILYGSIEAVEKSGGDVMGFMGDAFLAIFMNPEDVFESCIAIARDIDKMIEYIESIGDQSHVFPHMPKGPAIKVGIEYGIIDISEIKSNFLGRQKLFIGSPINYAARIAKAGTGNRCNIGPKAIELLRNEYKLDEDVLSGPLTIKGKKGELDYIYYNILLGQLLFDAGKDTFWKTTSKNI